jgi:hypothetical protein
MSKSTPRLLAFLAPILLVGCAGQPPVAVAPPVAASAAPAPPKRLIESAVDLVVFIARKDSGGGRIIEEIFDPGAAQPLSSSNPKKENAHVSL